MSYDIKEHKHRYAAWAASRASSVKGCRFKVRKGEMIIEKIKLKDLIDCSQKLPQPSTQFDIFHRELREAAITESKNLDLNFTHGVAAKLINVYMKTIFICGDHSTCSVIASIHPPIDGLLLKSLYDKNIGGLKEEWRIAISKRWSKFDSATYELVIKNIRKVQGNKPLWEIEEHWQGYR